MDAADRGIETRGLTALSPKGIRHHHWSWKMENRHEEKKNLGRTWKSTRKLKENWMKHCVLGTWKIEIKTNWKSKSEKWNVASKFIDSKRDEIIALKVIADRQDETSENRQEEMKRRFKWIENWKNGEFENWSQTNWKSKSERTEKIGEEMKSFAS